MSTPYAGGGFDKSEIRVLPGCCFWEDPAGTIYLGYTVDGGQLKISQGLDADKADESGNIPLNYRAMGADVQLTLKLLQTTKDRIARIVPEATLNGGNIRVGLQPGSIITKTGKVVHRPFGYGNGSEDFVIEEAVCTSDLTLAHSHKDRMTMDVTFQGLLIETRQTGDLLGAGIGQTP